MEEKEANEFEADGQVNFLFAAGIGIIVFGIVTPILLTLGSSVSGSIYNASQAQINAITDANIKAAANNSVLYGFQAMQTSGQFSPTIVLIGVLVVLMLGLGIVVNATSGFGMGGGGGNYGGNF